MKVFIAIDFSDDHKKRIYQEVEKLKKDAAKGSFVRWDNIHVTIQYIGEMNPNEVSVLAKHIVAFSFHPFEIQLSEMNIFKRQDHHNIYYMHIIESTELKRLVQQIQGLLEHLKIDYDKKPYKGHITLGRRISLKHNNIPKVGFDESYSILVDQITLMESTFDQNKLIYKPLSKSTVGKKGNNINEIS